MSATKIDRIKELMDDVMFETAQDQKDLVKVNEELKHKIEIEKELFNGTLATGDFRQNEQFMSPTQLKEKISAQNPKL